MNLTISLESVVVPFGLVLVVFEAHEADGKQSKSQYDAADEAWSIEAGKLN